MNRSVALQLWAVSALFPLFYLNGSELALDFTPLWLAGKQIVNGQAVDIYNSAGSIFPYPPHAGLIFAPFGLLEFPVAALIWTALGVTFFYWAAKPYLPLGFPPILSVLTPAAAICAIWGQTGLLLGGLWLLAFSGRWASVALLTFKPHLGALGILSLKNSSQVAKVTGLVIGLVLLSIALLGPAVWLGFINHGLDHAARIDGYARWKFAGVSPAMAFGFWGWLPFATAALILLARNVNAFTAATASFLISPYGFHYDLTVVSLGFGLLAFERWHELGADQRTAVALGFLSPGLAIAGVWWIPPILLWGLWVQVGSPTRTFRVRRNKAEGNHAPSP